MEPFLEPWIFQLEQTKNDNNSNLILSNYQIKDQEPQYIKEHQNSLNINITAPFLETVMEAKKIFQEDIIDAEPYLLYNKTGGYVLELKEQRSNTDCIYLEHDNKVEWRGSLFQNKKFYITCTFMKKEQYDEAKQLKNPSSNLLGFIPRVPSQQADEKESDTDQVYINNASPNKTKYLTNNNNSTNSPPEIEFSKQQNIIQQQQQNSQQLYVKTNSNQNGNNISNNNMNQSSTNGNTTPTQIRGNSKKMTHNNISKLAGRISQSNTFVSSYFKKTQTISQKLDTRFRSEYRPLKYGRIDQIGKQLFSLDKKGEQKQINKEKSFLNKIYKDLKITNTEKVNDEGKIYFMYDVQIDNNTGSKKVVMSSSVRLLNELECTINIKLIIKTSKDDDAPTTRNYANIKHKDIFYVPIDCLIDPSLTEVQFIPQNSKLNNDQEWENTPKVNRKFTELQSYNLKDLIKDCTQYTDFCEEEPLTYSELFPENLQDNISKKILIHKQDINIQCYNQNKQDKETNNFYFAISTLKNQHHISNSIDEELGYETVLSLKPFIQFHNLIPHGLIINWKNKNSKQQDNNQEYVLPGETVTCNMFPYSEDIYFNLTVDTFQQTSPIKVLTNKKNKWVCDVKMIVDEQGRKNNGGLVLLMDILKNSENNRDVTLYSPYLIHNETNLLLKFREIGIAQKIEGHISEIKQTIQFKNQYYKNKQNQNILVEDLQKLEKDNNEILNKIHQLQMLSPTKDIASKFQISMVDQNFKSYNWSNTFALKNNDEGVVEVSLPNLSQNNELQLIKSHKNKDKSDIIQEDLQQKAKNSKNLQIDLGIRISQAEGQFHRSKIINIVPRYIIINDSPYNIALTQKGSDIIKDEIIYIEKLKKYYFNWPDKKKPKILVASYYEMEGNGQKDDKHKQAKFDGWSSPFQICKVNDFAINMQKKKYENDEVTTLMHKVKITLQENVIVVRFMEEDLQNPPFFLRNLTNYDIYYRQQLDFGNGGCCSKKKKNVQQNEMKQLYPGDIQEYTWEQWMVDKNDHILEVDIEGHNQKYNIDKIQDYKPISLKRRNYQKKFNKKFLYKKGILVQLQERMEEDENYQEELLGILDVHKQMLKLFSTQNNQLNCKISLKNAKIEEGKNNEFIISKGQDVKILQAQSQEECKQWIEYAWRAVLVYTPDLVQFKIEPMNHSKVLIFYVSQFNQESADEILENQHKNVNKTSTMTVSINNTIGISIVDCIPREIMQISLKNLKITQSVTEEYTQDSQPKVNEEDYDKDQSNLQMSQSISNPNQMSNMSQQGSTIVKQLTDRTQSIIKKTLHTVTLDYLIINNQLSESQFPVIFAPNRKKDNNDIPFLNLSVIQKEILNKTDNKQAQDPNQKVNNQNIKYVQLFHLFLDTIEIRIDDYFIEAIILFINQIMPTFRNQEKQMAMILYNFTPLPQKINIQQDANQNDQKADKYIKNMKLDPIEICLTFRSSPGHQMQASTQNIISNFGLTLVSIDSAKIKLNSLFFNHVFGQMGEIGSKIGSHYTKQILTQLYRIFGSFELLGNPVSLIENLGTGVIDMFYDPIKALKKGKGGLKVTATFVQGTYKFIANTIHNVWTTVNKIINTIMKLLTSITLHKQYMHERQNRQNRHIKNFKDGFVIGLKNFLSIIWEAFSGVIMRPIREAQERGLFGFFIGIWQGLTGLFIKPVVGAYDLIITISEGMINHSKYEESIMEVRSRPPRIFGDNNTIIPFDFVPSVGIEIITKYNKKPLSHEKILYYEEIQRNNSKNNIGLLVVTDIRVIYALKRSNIDFKKLKLCKVKSIIYKQRNNRLIFQTDIPIKTGFCQKRSNNWSIKYSNINRAQLFFDKISQEFQKSKLYDLDMQIITKDKKIINYMKKQEVF